MAVESFVFPSTQTRFPLLEGPKPDDTTRRTATPAPAAEMRAATPTAAPTPVAPAAQPAPAQRQAPVSPPPSRAARSEDRVEGQSSASPNPSTQTAQTAPKTTQAALAEPKPKAKAPLHRSADLSVGGLRSDGGARAKSKAVAASRTEGPRAVPASRQTPPPPAYAVQKRPVEGLERAIELACPDPEKAGDVPPTLEVSLVHPTSGFDDAIAKCRRERYPQRRLANNMRWRLNFVGASRVEEQKALKPRQVVPLHIFWDVNMVGTREHSEGIIAALKDYGALGRMEAAHCLSTGDTSTDRGVYEVPSMRELRRFSVLSEANDEHLRTVRSVLYNVAMEEPLHRDQELYNGWRDDRTTVETYLGKLNSELKAYRRAVIEFREKSQLLPEDLALATQNKLTIDEARAVLAQLQELRQPVVTRDPQTGKLHPVLTAEPATTNTIQGVVNAVLKRQGHGKDIDYLEAECINDLLDDRRTVLSNRPKPPSFDDYPARRALRKLTLRLGVGVKLESSTKIASKLGASTVVLTRDGDESAYPPPSPGSAKSQRD